MKSVKYPLNGETDESNTVKSDELHEKNSKTCKNHSESLKIECISENRNHKPSKIQ